MCGQGADGREASAKKPEPRGRSQDAERFLALMSRHTQEQNLPARYHITDSFPNQLAYRPNLPTYLIVALALFITCSFSKCNVIML